MGVAWLALWALIAASRTDDVSTWIEILGSPRYAERQRAAQTLLELRSDALPALRDALDSPDPEIRDRAASLIDTIEAMELIRPTPIRLDYQERPLVDVVRDIGRQSGISLRLPSAPSSLAELSRQPITLVSREPVPFWKAVELLGDATKLEVRIEDRTERQGSETLVSLGTDRRKPRAVDADGVVRAELIDIVRRGDSMAAAIRLRAEPRLRLRISEPPADLSAIDEQGETLLGSFEPNRGAMDEGFADGDRNGGVTLWVPLKRPSGGTTMRLSGSVPIALAVRRTEPTLVVPFSEAEGRWQVLGDVVVHMRRQPTTPGATQGVLSIRIASLDNDPDAPLDLSDDQIEVVDGRGDPLPQYPGGSVYMWGGGPGFNRRFARPWGNRTYTHGLDDDRQPAELRYYELRQTGTVIRFDFRDVPVP
jgi:hypothetical protein